MGAHISFYCLLKGWRWHATPQVNLFPNEARLIGKSHWKWQIARKVNKWRIIIVSYLLTQRFFSRLSLDVITNKKQDICKVLKFLLYWTSVTSCYVPGNGSILMGFLWIVLQNVVFLLLEWLYLIILLVCCLTLDQEIFLSS